MLITTMLLMQVLKVIHTRTMGPKIFKYYKGKIGG